VYLAEYPGADGSVGPGHLVGSLYVATPSGAAERGISALFADGEPHPTHVPGTVAEQISKLCQDVARLIDSDTERLIDKTEFESRLLRFCQRLLAGKTNGSSSWKRQLCTQKCSSLLAVWKSLLPQPTPDEW
jgi:hypothetical protein